MIVTRKRRKRRNYLPIILPVAAIAALVVAVSWPPSHDVIVNGPLKPVATVIGNVVGTLGKPLTFAAQQDQLAARNRELRRLNDTLEADRKTADAKDQKISSLQQQLAALTAVPAATPTPPRPSPSTSALAPAGGSASEAVRDDVKRTAAYWTSMDAEKAAAIVQRLPDAYVNAVLAQMSSDSVGDILNALPPKVAARLAAQAAGLASPAPTAAPARRIATAK